MTKVMFVTSGDVKFFANNVYRHVTGDSYLFTSAWGIRNGEVWLGACVTTLTTKANQEIQDRYRSYLSSLVLED